MYKRFGWDDEIPDQFNGLELNRVLKRGVEVHPMDNLNVATAMTAAGTYDWKRDGRPPMVPEKLFMAVENFQRQQGLKVDGIMNPGGPTQTRLNEVLPAKMERPFIMSKRLPPPEPDDPSRGKTWAQVWRERRAAGLPAIISTDPHSEGYEGREPRQIQGRKEAARAQTTQPAVLPSLGLSPPAAERREPLKDSPRQFRDDSDTQEQVAQGGQRRSAPVSPVQNPDSPNRTIHGFLDRSYGVRNNNPLNVTRGPANDPWLGQEGPNRIPSFDTPENGIRAATLNIWTRYFRDNLRTVRQLVDGWANTSPESERGPYRNSVAQALSAFGIAGQDTRIPEQLLSNPNFLLALISAMAAQENQRIPREFNQAARRGIDLAIAFELRRPRPRIFEWPATNE